jgi:uncharacterized protein
MAIVDQVNDALKTGNYEGILDFNGYIIENIVKGGEQGIVFKVRNFIDKKFALKLYPIVDRDHKKLKKAVEDFNREIKILSALHHKNIVKISTAGCAKIEEGDQKWHATEGFVPENPECEFFYSIMEFIEGEDISSIFPELMKPADFQPGRNLSIGERLKHFEQLIGQITSAMIYYHQKDITHKDIKPDNIRFSSEDPTFILVDFGLARHHFSHQDMDALKRTEYFDAPSLLKGEYVKNDLAQFAKILLKILPSFKYIYDIDRYKGIESALMKAEDPDLQLRFKDAYCFFEFIKHYFLVLPEWKFIIRQDEYLTPNLFGKFHSKIRLPVSGSIFLTEEIREIIDSPEFQRLRGVRQLGPTIFVYPGANHTRFEHSLGTYFLSIRYLEKLLKLPIFREVCEPIDESVKMIILSSLLHDIGHYPYSHWIEEIDEFPKGVKFPKHEERARKILSNGRLGKMLEENWEINSETLSNIIANEHTGGRELLINSFINSIIDVDKIDYLTRDSVHCGVNYGEGIDLEILLDSLYVNPDTKKICLTDKGKSCLHAILTCRNIMYQVIYWHKTVRACDAMFKRFFYEYINKGIDDPRKIENYFWNCDDHFIATLYSKCEKLELAKLIAPFAFGGRLLYKPAYIFFKSNPANEPTDTCNFFSKVFEWASYDKLVHASNKLTECLRANYIDDVEPFDIIVEKTPTKEGHSKYLLHQFEFWNIRKKMFESYPVEFNDLNQYLDNNVQGYIFCNPKHYEKMRDLVLTKELDKILGMINI